MRFGEPRQFWQQTGVGPFDVDDGPIGIWRNCLPYATVYESPLDIVFPLFDWDNFEFIVLNDKKEPELLLTYDEAFAILKS